MDDFYIDKLGDEDGDEDNKKVDDFWSENDEPDDAEDEKIIELPDLLELEEKRKLKQSNKKFTLQDTYLTTNYTNLRRQVTPSSDVDKMLKNCVITPGFEQEHAVLALKSHRLIKMERKKLRDRTKGNKWFDIPATEVTEEIKNDFQVLKMRGVLDKKHFYKKNDITSLPKYFQVGTVVENPADFYSGRIVKSQRKKTLVEELLADAEFKSYQKKKYKEIMDTNRRKKRSGRESPKRWKKAGKGIKKKI